MTIFRTDMATPAVLESVGLTLAPLTEAVGAGLSRLGPSLLPRGWSFELQGGSRGRGPAQARCVWVELRTPLHRTVDKAWAEPGWSLGALVLLLYDVGLSVRPSVQEALETVTSAMIVGGYVGRSR